jgi:hypothetical protein
MPKSGWSLFGHSSTGPLNNPPSGFLSNLPSNPISGSLFSNLTNSASPVSGPLIKLQPQCGGLFSNQPVVAANTSISAEKSVFNNNSSPPAHLHPLSQNNQQKNPINTQFQPIVPPNTVQTGNTFSINNNPQQKSDG